MNKMVSPAAWMEIVEMQIAFNQQSKGYGHKILDQLGPGFLQV
jgi:hypothetical protein